MAIYGIGAYQDRDVSADFIQAGGVFVGWDANDAPDLHQFLRQLRTGDIVFIKSAPRGRNWMEIIAVGVILDGDVLPPGQYPIGRRVRWICTQRRRVPIPQGKNNVRFNTLYEEFHPEIQRIVMEMLTGANSRSGT